MVHHRGMSASHEPYYRTDLALVHDRGFGFHARMCAPGILELLAPVLDRRGLVLEVGCGSGLLTKELVAAGHRVIASDASPAMLELTRQGIEGVHDVRQVALPDDEVPHADAIVGVGHALNYLPNATAIDQALLNLAAGLRPGGILAVDICDLAWNTSRAGAPNQGRVGDDWAIISRFSMPTREQFVREMTTFLRNEDGSWRRDDERHDNVLVDTSRLPALLATAGIQAEVRDTFGSETLPPGLKVLIGHRPR
jgi:SAM-dependent methyltransferase